MNSDLLSAARIGIQHFKLEAARTRNEFAAHGNAPDLRHKVAGERVDIVQRLADIEAFSDGLVHVFPNDQKATQTKPFLDLRDKVRYSDNANEEGFLGLAFHPDYKKTGEFYAFYTDRRATLTNVVSRFKVSKDDPDKADPASEEELLRIPHKFWNHDGGTLAFGPDGCLYVAIGDGGSANDPDENGQNERLRSSP